MPLDTRIALSGQPLQVQFRDPIASYNQLAQLTSADTQNQLAQMQMQEHQQMAPFRMQQAQTQAASAKLTYDQAKQAQDFVTGVMSKAAEHPEAPQDPMDAAMQMLQHPNPQVQVVGGHLLDASQKLMAYKNQIANEKAYAEDQRTGGVAPTPAGAPAVVSTGSVNGTELPMVAAGVMQGGYPSQRDATMLPQPANALAAQVAPAVAAAPAVNAMIPAVASALQNADAIKKEIEKGDEKYARGGIPAPGWKSKRELLVEAYKQALKPGRADTTFGAINPSEYTPESIKAFQVSKNYGDLVAKSKIEKMVSAVNPADYTPASVELFAVSGKFTDLVPKPGKAEKEASLIANVSPNDYTPASLKIFAISKDYGDLVRNPSKAEQPAKLIANVSPSDFTPASLAAFNLSGKYEDLVRNPSKAEQPAKLIANVNPSDYTPESIKAFSISSDYGDLVLKPSKADKVDKTISNINADSYTPASVQAFALSGNYNDLVRNKESAGNKIIANVNPNDFTTASIQKFAVTSNYNDLVRIPEKVSGAAGKAKPPSGYRYDASGENLEVIPGGPADKQEKLKPIPANINTAISTNDMSIRRLQEALDLIKKNPDAIGLKNLLPGQALDRMDPKGVAARSAIGDIGSLVIHDRSGAAVSSSEMQRLGFIPTPTDRADNAKTKLEAMLKWAKLNQQGLSETYGENQGYKPSPTLSGKSKAAPATVSNW